MTDRNPQTSPVAQLRFPFEDVPPFGEFTELAEGLFWTRIPLPFRLDHVNIFFLKDGDGWAVIDSGINTKEALSVWEKIEKTFLKGSRITRVIVTHHHPDHIGLAGWLCNKYDAELFTSYSAYMGSKVVSLGADEHTTRYNFEFYRSHGMSAESAGLVAIQGSEYLRLVSPLPNRFVRLLMPDVLEIGDRKLRIISGDGHAHEQVMLYSESENLLFAADQVLEKISPNISVFANEPLGDPLGHYLRSLRFLAKELPESVLVLPGHRRPFFGLSQRCAELEAHHEERCDRIRVACSARAHSVAELVPLLFERKLDPHQMSFAFTETLAHVNRLVRRGEISSCLEGNQVVNVAV